MANKDAEMPTHHALREEVDKIAKHLHTLRKDIDGLTGAVADGGRASGRTRQGCGGRGVGGDRGRGEAQTDPNARHRAGDRLSRRHYLAALAAVRTRER